MTLPNPVVATDAELEAEYTCYGYLYAVGDANCTPCVVRDRCVSIIVKDRIPALRAGGAKTTVDLAKQLDTTNETVQLLVQIEKGKKLSEVLPPQPTPSGEPAPLQTLGAPEEAAAVAAKLEAQQQVFAPPATPEAAAEVKANVTGADLPATKPKKPPPKKDKPKPTEIKTVDGTATIEPAKTAAEIDAELAAKQQQLPLDGSPPPGADALEGVLVEEVLAKDQQHTEAPSSKDGGNEGKSMKKKTSKKAAAAPKKAKHAAPATPAQSAKQGRATSTQVSHRVEHLKAHAPKFDKDAFALQWERERARSPAVAALKVGSKLSKTYCGVDVVVDYEQGFVFFENKRYPTLSAVKTAVVGKKKYPAQSGDGERAMSDWSVPRFFHLDSKKSKPKVIAKAKLPSKKTTKKKKAAKKASKKSK